MSKSVTSLCSIFALLTAAIVVAPGSVQASSIHTSGSRAMRASSVRVRPAVSSVSTSYRFRTVPRVSNVNRVRNVTHTSTRNVTQTRFRNIQKTRFHDITRTNVVHHIHRVVTVTRVQPIVRVHTLTRVHHVVLTRVHTRVIPRVHVTVIPRIHTHTVMVTHIQHVAQTRMLPTRFMRSASTVSMGTRMSRVSAGSSTGRSLYSYVRIPAHHVRIPATKLRIRHSY